MLRAWLAVSGIIWPNWRVFNTPGPGPGPALLELRLYLLATHRPTQHSLQTPRISSLPLPLPHTSNPRGLAGGQQQSEGGSHTAYVCFMSCTPCRRALSLREKKLPNSIFGTGNELLTSLKHRAVYTQGSGLWQQLCSKPKGRRRCSESGYTCLHSTLCYKPKQKAGCLKSPTNKTTWSISSKYRMTFL